MKKKYEKSNNRITLYLLRISGKKMTICKQREALLAFVLVTKYNFQIQ